MSTIMMERAGVTMPGMGMPGMGTGTVGTPALPTNYMMVPRCKMTVEKCPGGMKIHCVCDDTAACSMLQNLCQMLQGGMVSCCCLMNGMPVCTCCLTMGLCKVETTAKGCCVTCTSGDAACCAMIQGCCDCLAAMLKAGCTCCLMMGNNPVCCGC